MKKIANELCFNRNANKMLLKVDFRCTGPKSKQATEHQQEKIDPYSFHVYFSVKLRSTNRNE